MPSASLSILIATPMTWKLEHASPATLASVSSRIPASPALFRVILIPTATPSMDQTAQSVPKITSSLQVEDAKLSILHATLTTLQMETAHPVSRDMKWEMETVSSDNHNLRSPTVTQLTPKLVNVWSVPSVIILTLKDCVFKKIQIAKPSMTMPQYVLSVILDMIWLTMTVRKDMP